METLFMMTAICNSMSCHCFHRVRVLAGIHGIETFTVVHEDSYGKILLGFRHSFRYEV